LKHESSRNARKDEIIIDNLILSRVPGELDQEKRQLNRKKEAERTSERVRERVVLSGSIAGARFPVDKKDTRNSP